MLVTSIFSFSHNVFYPIKKKVHHLSYFNFVCKVFKFELNNKFLDWSKLKAYADDKNEHNRKIKICFWKGRKHCGKRRKCWFPEFSPFPTMFSKGSFFKVCKIQDKELNLNQSKIVLYCKELRFFNVLY